MPPILPHDSILAIHAAAIDAGLAEHRSGLLAGLPGSITAGLEGASSPATQLLLDLTNLNGAGTLVDGSVPLVLWLQNARSLVGSRNEGLILDRFLVHLHDTSGALKRVAAASKGAPIPRPLSTIQRIAPRIRQNAPRAALLIALVAAAGVLFRQESRSGEAPSSLPSASANGRSSTQPVSLAPSQSADPLHSLTPAKAPAPLAPTTDPSDLSPVVRVQSTLSPVSNGPPPTSPAHACDSDDSDPRFCSYRGSLRELSGEPIVGADLELMGTTCVTKSDTHGRFIFRDCDPYGVRRLVNPRIFVRLPGGLHCDGIPVLRPPKITEVRVDLTLCQDPRKHRRAPVNPIPGHQLIPAPIDKPDSKHSHIVTQMPLQPCFRQTCGSAQVQLGILLGFTLVGVGIQTGFGIAAADSLSRGDRRQAEPFLALSLGGASLGAVAAVLGGFALRSYLSLPTRRFVKPSERSFLLPQIGPGYVGLSYSF